MKEHNTIGIDMGDRKHQVCILNAQGDVTARNSVSNTAVAIRKHFKNQAPCVFALEAGTHSAWVSHVLEQMGHTVLVGNPRRLRAIWESDQKDDLKDAEMLARIARLDPKLLYPIHHRSLASQKDFLAIKARDALVKARSMHISHIRGSVKSLGQRLPKCSTASFHKRARLELDEELLELFEPLITVLEIINQKIVEYDKIIIALCRDKYPETAKLMRVKGVGAITALAFVLALEDPERFRKSRDVGPFLGLTPRRAQSGNVDKQLPITKAGDTLLRRLLVGSANYILGVFGEPCELQSFGLKIAERGGKNARKRAKVAVARKLGVLLHRLWIEEEEYDPFYQQNKKSALKAA